MGYDWNTWPRHFRPSVASTTAFWNSTEIRVLQRTVKKIKETNELILYTTISLQQLKLESNKDDHITFQHWSVELQLTINTSKGHHSFC